MHLIRDASAAQAALRHQTRERFTDSLQTAGERDHTASTLRRRAFGADVRRYRGIRRPVAHDREGNAEQRRDSAATGQRKAIRQKQQPGCGRGVAGNAVTASNIQIMTL